MSKWLLRSNKYRIVVYIRMNFNNRCAKIFPIVHKHHATNSSRNKATPSVRRICIKLRFRSKQLSICNHWQTLIIAKENIYGKLIKWMLWVKISNLLPVAFRDVSSQFSCGRVLQCTSRLGNELLCCLAESIKMKLKMLICDVFATITPWENKPPDL